jgi:peptidyl-dipeptidase Dcp
LVAVSQYLHMLACSASCPRGAGAGFFGAANTRPAATSAEANTTAAAVLERRRFMRFPFARHCYQPLSRPVEPAIAPRAHIALEFISQARHLGHLSARLEGASVTPLRPIALCSLVLAACASVGNGSGASTNAAAKGGEAPPPAAVPATARTEAPAMAKNPFFAPSPLPLHYPPFDRIHDADYLPAFEAGMAEHLKEVQAIAGNPAAPTFENTLVALEKSGRLLDRVAKTFSNLNGANGNPEMQKIEAQMAPKMAAHRDAILLDPALFARVDALYQKRAQLGLDPESLQLLRRYETMFVRAGAKLSPQNQEKLKKLNQELSSLSTRFRQDVLKATKEGAVVVDDVKELDGLSQQQIGAAAQAARARGIAGKWVITLQNTTIQPPLEQMKDRALRERVFKASVSRAAGGDADNTGVVAQMVRLRSEKAALFGDPNWAAYTLADETAGTPAAVNDMLGKLAPAALAKAKKDASDLQSIIDAQARKARTMPFKLEPWDWAFYAEQLRKARYDFDDAQVKPYFEINRVLKDGVFYAANQLYGITFKERHDLPVYHDDVRVFDVIDADGSPLGIFIGDYYKRDNKQGGAWMNTYVSQSDLLDQKPVASNNLNIPKPAPGEPTLLTFEEVTTMFHEFGHALHGLFSHVKYPLLSMSVPRDFVEYPSQFNEMWAREPKVLANFARNYKNGEAMPRALFDKVMAAQSFDSGYATTEYLEAAMLDQDWHQLPEGRIPPASQVTSFDSAALQKDGVLYPPIPPRYHTTYFSHIFASGYSAAYYAYIWSEVLARDSGQWFHAHGGMTRENGNTFRDKVLSRGRTREPLTLFEDFYGGPPVIGPLLEYRGLTMPQAAK